LLGVALGGFVATLQITFSTARYILYGLLILIILWMTANFIKIEKRMEKVGRNLLISVFVGIIVAILATKIWDAFKIYSLGVLALFLWLLFIVIWLFVFERRFKL
jgi:hypothetical protein